MDLNKLKIVTFVENIDWVRLWWLVGIVTAFWAGLTALSVMYPWFDTAYKVVNIFLGALVNAALFAARGGKYVRDRTEPPPQDGKV